MRNFAIALLLAVLITYSCGHLFSDWLDISIRMDDELLNPFDAIAGFTLVGAMLVIIGFVLALSLFGVMFIAVVAVLAGLIVAGLSAFWPMLLLLAAVIWLVRDKRQARL